MSRIVLRSLLGGMATLLLEKFTIGRVKLGGDVRI